jgi:hypothetical protein
MGKMDEQIKNTDGEDGRGNKKRWWFAGVGCGARVRRPVIQKKKLLSSFFCELPSFLPYLCSALYIPKKNCFPFSCFHSLNKLF